MTGELRNALGHSQQCHGPVLAQECTHLDVNLGAVERASALVHHIWPALQCECNPVKDGRCAVLAAAATQQAASYPGQTKCCSAEVLLLLTKVVVLRTAPWPRWLL